MHSTFCMLTQPPWCTPWLHKPPCREKVTLLAATKSRQPIFASEQVLLSLCTNCFTSHVLKSQSFPPQVGPPKPLLVICLTTHQKVAWAEKARGNKTRKRRCRFVLLTQNNSTCSGSCFLPKSSTNNVKEFWREMSVYICWKEKWTASS